MKPGSSDCILTALSSIVMAAALFVAQYFTSAPRTNVQTPPSDRLSDSHAITLNESDGGSWKETAFIPSTPAAIRSGQSFDRPFTTGQLNSNPTSRPSLLRSTSRRKSNRTQPTTSANRNQAAGGTRSFEPARRQNSATAHRMGI